MKYFLALALIAAVASAGVIKPALITEEMQQISEIIAAINSPSTDPATAVLLEQMLYETLGLSPVAVGPAIIDGVSPVAVGPVVVEEVSPVAVGPVVVEGISPVAVGPVVVEDVAGPAPVGPAGGAEEVAIPTPVDETPAATAQSSLVQIIINVNAAATGGVKPVLVGDNEVVVPEVPGTPVQVAEEAIPAQVSEEATPVQVVDEVAPVEEDIVIPAPIVLPEVVAPVVVEPVQIAEPVLPVTVVEAEKPTPIAVGEPTLPIAVQPVVLPEILN